MWDTPFDVSMLSLEEGVVIHCPEEHLAWELFDIFAQNGVGVNWSHSNWNPKWDEHQEETAYFVKNSQLLYGPKGHVEDYDDSYSKYKKCTFFGDTTPDFEAASDDELKEFLGIGGG